MEQVFSSYTHCEALSGEFRGKLCEQLTSRPHKTVAQGDYVYLSGDPATSIYFVRAGLVKVSVPMEDGKEVLLRIYQAGEIFGEFCLCSGTSREQAQTMENSEIVEISFEDLLAHLQHNRQALMQFLNSMSRRLAGAYEQIHILSFDRRMERLIRTLLRLAHDMGESTEQGIKIEPILTQDDLAQMIAARREVTSTLLNQLRNLRLIDYSRGGHILINQRGLEEYLASHDDKVVADQPLTK